MMTSVPASTRDEGTLIDRTIGAVAGPTPVGPDGPAHDAPRTMPAAVSILIARRSVDRLGASAAPTTPGASASGDLNRPSVDEDMTDSRVGFEQIAVGDDDVGDLALLD